MGTKPTRLSGSYNTGVRLPLEAGLRLPGPHLPLLRPRQLGGLRLRSRLPSPPGLHPYHHPHLPLHQRQLPLAPPQAQESPPRHPGPPLFQPPIPILMTWEPQASRPSRPRDLDPPRPRPQFLPLRLLPGAQASRPSRPRGPGPPRPQFMRLRQLDGTAMDTLCCTLLQHEVHTSSPSPPPIFSSAARC